MMPELAEASATDAIGKSAKAVPIK